MKLAMAIFLLVAWVGGVTGSAIGRDEGRLYFFGFMQDMNNVASASSKAVQSDVLGDVRPLLLQKTRVPLRLPNLHFAYGDEKGLYAIIEDAVQSHYEVQIALTKDCPGGNYCHVGTVRGSSAPLVENEGPKVPITLEGGIKGYFIDATCAAFCDDSSVSWKEGNYYYSITLKAAKKQIMLTVANSAIGGWPRSR